MTSRILIIACLLCSQAAAGECRSVAGKSPATVTVVPFAVPVAVPVAVVQQPGVLYGYAHGCAAPAAVSSSESSATALSQSAGGNEQPTADSATAVFLRHCAACHTAPLAKGGLSLFAADGTAVTRLPRQKILDAVTADENPPRMPPADRPALSDEELELLRQWARPPRDLVY